ncbi:Rubrerythrin [Natronincola peptidivorans]|uniref:Rubrerythrin n=1 Tax=Natronincola peptidivorans TaxID=426128 RepID=A0A1I0BXZ8_9FIRM|nr:ferritin family protein [Natronincola peptidivorans]SET11950.1 Rubrerythrin [Natronincola peptidivorans]
MSITFDSCKILQVLITLERRGHEFYLEAAHAMKDNEAKNMFFKLAQDELEHERVYKELMAKLPETKQCSIAAEEADFLELLLSTNFFINDHQQVDKMKKMWSKREALLIAEKLERDTILFLTELAALDPELAEENVIKAALKEERRHLSMILQRIMDANVPGLML